MSKFRHYIFKGRIRWYEKDLGKYIHQRMKEENITKDDLDEDTINFFFQQYKIRSCSGHSEWSERFQQNIWIEDD